MSLYNALDPQSITNDPRRRAELLAAGQTIRGVRDQRRRHLSTTLAALLLVFVLGALLGGWLVLEVVTHG